MIHAVVLLQDYADIIVLSGLNRHICVDVKDIDKVNYMT